MVVNWFYNFCYTKTKKKRTVKSAKVQYVPVSFIYKQDDGEAL